MVVVGVGVECPTYITVLKLNDDTKKITISAPCINI